MQSGAGLATAVETLLQTVRLHVAISRRENLSSWSHGLCSPFWRLYVNKHPGAFIVANRKTIPLGPGSLYLIPAWVAFETGLKQPTEHCYIHFYVTGLPHSLHEKLFPHPIGLPCNDVLGPLVRRWQSTLEKDFPQDLAAFGWASAVVQAAFATAVESLSTMQRQASLRWLTMAQEIRPALNAIEVRLADPPTNEELAALCSVSVNYLIRFFRRSMGSTPARYGLERRLAIASGLLIGTSKAIEHIAAETGFVDRFHFSRAFKTRFGAAPAAFRQMHWYKSSSSPLPK